MKTYLRISKSPVLLGLLLTFVTHIAVAETFEDDFEKEIIDEGMWQFDYGDNCEITLVDSPVRNGVSAAQFQASDNARCELVPNTIRGRFGALKRKFIREPYQKNRWYKFSTFLHEPWEHHDSNEVLAQWHASPDPFIADEHGRGPPLALRVTQGYFRISYGWDNTFRSTEKHIAKYTLWYDRLETGAWIDWVFQVRWSYEKDGLIRIWKNGDLIVDYAGPNAYNDLRGVYLKLGVYHPSLERTVTFDDVYIDDEPPAQFAEKATLETKGP